jgi:hypothetical protein
MPFRPPSSRSICFRASIGPVYRRCREVKDCTISRVRIKSNGERMKPVSTCEATGKMRGGWWNGDSEGKKRDCKKASMRGCKVVERISVTVEVRRPGSNCQPIVVTIKYRTCLSRGLASPLP